MVCLGCGRMHRVPLGLSVEQSGLGERQINQTGISSGSGFLWSAGHLIVAGDLYDVSV